MNGWRKWLMIAGLLAAMLPAGRAALLADSPGTPPAAVVNEVTAANADPLESTGALVEPADIVDSTMVDNAVVDVSSTTENGAAPPVANEIAEEMAVEEAAAADVVAVLSAWRMLEPEYSAATPLPISGKAMYYNPGVMATVIESRKKYDQIEPCTGCIGYVAMLRYGDLDRRVWLQIGGTRLEGPFHVVDAAATQHVGQLLARGWAIDVDHATAQRWNMRMPYVTIWEEPPLDLLLANVTRPLHWSATLVPSDSFAGAPQSDNVRPDDSHVVVKHDVAQRSRTMQSYVDLAAETPPELYVK